PAYDALENGSLDDAAAALDVAIRQNPGDPEAKAMLAQVELLRRREGSDPAAALAAARHAGPGGAETQLPAAAGRGRAGRPGAAPPPARSRPSCGPTTSR